MNHINEAHPEVKWMMDKFLEDEDFYTTYFLFCEEEGDDPEHWLRWEGYHAERRLSSAIEGGKELYLKNHNNGDWKLNDDMEIIDWLDNLVKMRDIVEEDIKGVIDYMDEVMREREAFLNPSPEEVEERWPD